nr:MAG TPA: hypothetical protein [Bacteriophage sp.]
MKKVIIAIMATVCVMSIGFYGVMMRMNAKYDEDLNNLKNDYDRQIQLLIDKNTDSNNRMSELETQVWNKFNKEPYEITVDHDGVTYIYKSDNNSIFSHEVRMVIQ